MRVIASGVLLLSSLSMLGQQSPGPAKTSGKKTIEPKQAAAVEQRGQLVLQRYCIRCHTPPQGFSPRISETIAMHMRVRANLSDADFNALVHFLNP